MQFTPLGPWGVGASAGPATEGLKGLSGRVADPNPCDKDQGGKSVKYVHEVGEVDGFRRIQLQYTAVFTLFHFTLFDVVSYHKIRDDFG